ncbi:NADPH-dependent 2,4-dienoyl-CoA reductase, sulfur reductase [Tistlia consotensis]|uniref:NADPH-dependent 2,4-dienoyl-CoA reductase, sulfur reductase n=1 Tax=Tistlia consotensis USBA 355 TaxID=560819 RepID=A0A1Y6CMK1_9PROT|nr:NAD(P)/FAD-dependent oxidoreductase [Tistlia consotensis]SMF77086.1 NADPH-dependent 2,4-dienoyl-CoA reductase, sulfur reductase [Tistlia consotensis USBA 355]SNS14114.1 NADPH-dependent 2,4-dienoyl-CoA reductase, sulfur reductase [Tistlia consotensis]
MRCDLAVIGAGPAGLAAATRAAEAGLAVELFDEQPAPGGQIYRAIETVPAPRRALLGPDYAAGAALAAAFRASGAGYRPGALVWNVDSQLNVDFSQDGRSRQCRARAVVVATGAIERPTPLPGWTLPGVTTAGALQILLKAQGLVPAEGVVLAGSGPLLLLLAEQLTRAGAAPRAIVETVPRGRLSAAARHLPAALRAPGYLAKGLAMLRALKRAGVPFHRGAEALAIEGADHAEALSFTAGGRRQRIESRLIALHQGVVPNQQMTRLLRCEHRWSDGQRCFLPVVDDWFESSVEKVFVAGDGAGIGGAKSAALRGRLAALGALRRLGAGEDKRLAGEAAALRGALDKDGAVRPLLEALYAPSAQILAPADDTLICRCEEVTAGALRKAVALGCPGPNQAKSFLRCGMGPCQGRLCGLAVSEVIAAERGEPQQTIDYYRIRPPLKPLPLAELAAFDVGDDAGDEAGDDQDAA